MKSITLKIAVILFCFLLGNNLFGQAGGRTGKQIIMPDPPLQIKLDVTYPTKHKEFNRYTSDGILKLEYTVTVPPWSIKLQEKKLDLKGRLEEYGWEVLSGPEGKIYDLTKELTEKLVYRVKPIKPLVKNEKATGFTLRIPYTGHYSCIIVEDYRADSDARKKAENEHMKKYNYSTSDEQLPDKWKTIQVDSNKLFEQGKTLFKQTKNIELKKKDTEERNENNKLNSVSSSQNTTQYSGYFYYKDVNGLDKVLQNFVLSIYGRASSNDDWQLLKTASYFNNTNGFFSESVDEYN